MSALRKGSELLKALRDCTERVLQEAGLPADQSVETARVIAERMKMAWLGALVYFPKGWLEDLDARNQQILEQLRGDNYDELAQRHNMSVQHIYAIIKSTLAKERARRQGHLPLVSEQLDSTTPVRRGSELLDDLRGHIAKAVVDLGMASDQAVKIAARVADTLKRQWGGSLVNFPKSMLEGAEECPGQQLLQLEE